MTDSKSLQFLNVSCSICFIFPKDLILVMAVPAKLLRPNNTNFGKFNSPLNFVQPWYLQPIITQYFIDNKSEIWLLFLIAHSKR